MELPAEIKDRLLIEVTKFCDEYGTPVHETTNFVANIGLIVVDYVSGSFNENYKEKSMQQIAEEIARDS